MFVADAWGTGATAGRAEVGPDGMIYLDRRRSRRRQRHGRRELPHARAGSRQPRRQGSAPARRRHGSGRQSVRRPRGREAGDLHLRPPQRARARVASRRPASSGPPRSGPMGGDELNRLVAGRNYGWPLVSLGKIYTGNLASEQSWSRPGMEMPVMFWVPAISPSSLMIYDGRHVPALARPLLHRRAERPAAAARRVQSAAAATRAPRVAAACARCARARRAARAGRLPLSRGRARPAIRARQRAGSHRTARSCGSSPPTN